MELAARLLAVASALRAWMGTPLRPIDYPLVNATVAAAQAGLGANAFSAAWKAAEHVPLEHVVRDVLTTMDSVGSVERVAR